MRKIIFVLVILIMIIASGCVGQEGTVKPAGPTPIEPEGPTPVEDLFPITYAATIEFDGTMISLEGIGEDNNTAIVRIDKIISIDNPDNIDVSDIYEGAELNSYFTYSYVPAKIRTFTEQVDGNTTSMRIASKDPIGYEDPYLIYENGNNVVEEIILSGLNEADQFTTTIGFLEPTSEYFKITIDEYEII